MCNEIINKNILRVTVVNNSNKINFIYLVIKMNHKNLKTELQGK